MKCKILHESAGRIHVRFEQKKMSLREADLAEYYLMSLPYVTGVTVFDRTCGVAVTYAAGKRGDVIAALSHFNYTDEKVLACAPEHSGRELSSQYEEKLVLTVLVHYTKKLFLPAPIRMAINSVKAVKYVLKGLKTLARGKLEVPVLDACAVSAAILQGDFDTAGSVMFLLHIGEILEEWTHKKSVDDLARTMSLNVDKVWLRKPDGMDVLVSVTDVAEGDEITVRTGSMIPLDGRVVSGEAMINQASMTGEAIPVRKTVGSIVYAGTVVEEGECAVRVEKSFGSGRYDRIVHMIEESEKLKSDTEARAGHLADRLVPWSLGGTALVWLITGNVTRAMSVLMVDYSCALKLAMPISVLSAMRESSTFGISVKGGKFMEAVAAADTIVFDKTGTLTAASPRLVDIVPFGGRNAESMLRLAACLEEHYPHSMANAVVRAAEERGLTHEEMHSSVNYIVAHGIASTVGGQRVIIGSHHFAFEDEACVIPEGEREKFEAIPGEYSQLYLAIDGVLAAVLCIEDPIKPGAAEAIRELHRLGIRKVIMMTGDSERTARAVAAAVGADEYYAEVLPEDKASFVKAARASGRKVIMVGDGVNDSPALSEADAGIAISTGAAIAREIADIVVSSADLNTLAILREESMALMERIQANYRFIMSFNTALILLGVAGILPPATSALLHNVSTLAIGMKSMTNLFPAEREQQLPVA